MNICEFLHLNFDLKRVYCVSREGGARGPGPREWGPHGDHRRGGAAAERGEGRGKGGDGPRLTPGRRRRRRGRSERREAAARLESTGSTAFRRSATETERWTRLARMRRSRRRRRRGGSWSGATTAADRSSAATAERESDVAGSNPARREGGERRKRTEEVRGGFK
uniref:Splicing coactivator subunit-like n=1 Tax=Oryza sativa subsp. japonica TaxID=39947 RepID=Q6YW71_ORYSJ|nr:splicing coactivator subunit-like [Oryza sativa Japonica Group]BAD05818.1 splicing coactivator subunit-like [Oryza sativa Japonica Group]